MSNIVFVFKWGADVLKSQRLWVFGNREFAVTPSRSLSLQPPSAILETQTSTETTCASGKPDVV